MKRPKLVKKWNDQIYSAEVKEYLYSNGVRLIEVVNSSSLEFDASVIVKGGSYFEHQIGVPEGTSHMLEHIIFGQPNKRQKTEKEIRSYVLGNKTRPSISMNAAVTAKNLYFYGSTHKKGALRLLKSLRYRLDYPLDKAQPYLKSERGVVEAEILGQKKEERDEGLQSIRFLLGDTYPEYQYRRTGTVETVNKITVESLIEFHKKCFTSDRTVICIQSHKKLQPDQWEEINKIARLFPEPESNLEITKHKIEDVFEMKHFQEPNNQSVFVSFAYFFPQVYTINYKSNVLFYLLNGLIRKVIFEDLRLEKRLIYSIQSVNSLINWDWRARGFKLESNKDSFLKVLDGLYDLINSGLENFLDSEDGEKWFTSRISDYIFPSNQNFSEDFAEQIGIDILEGNDYEFNNRSANAAAKAVTIKELKGVIKKVLLGRPPKLWLVSPFEEEEIIDLVKKSKWYSNYHK